MSEISRRPAPSTPPRLRALTGQPFTPTARTEGDGGYERMVGPVLVASTGNRTFDRVRIPLRPGSTAAGSPHLGTTLVFAVIQRTSGSAETVLARQAQVITQGMTEVVFNGPFTVPAGEQHAYLCGIVEGGRRDHVALFYGDSAVYPAPDQGTATAVYDLVPGAVGSGTASYAPAVQHRILLAEVDPLPKGVVGPLDAGDFPVVTSVAQLLPGQAALLDNGTDPPRLVRKRLDSSTPDVVASTPKERIGAGESFSGYSLTLDAGVWTRLLNGGVGAPRAVVPAPPSAPSGSRWVLEVYGFLRASLGSGGTWYFGAAVNGWGIGLVHGGGGFTAGETLIPLEGVFEITPGQNNVVAGQPLEITLQAISFSGGSLNVISNPQFVYSLRLVNA